MEAIKIRVSKNLDGFNFSILPSVRDLVRSLFPDARPANSIFVRYDIRDGIKNYPHALEEFIYPALLGVANQAELKQKVAEINFIDSQTDDVLHSLRLAP